MVQRFLSGLSALLLATGIVQGVRGGWIHVKAEFAQVLLDRSWVRTQEGEVEEKPWPWADTWPVARLILPGGDVHIVLAGATGRNLAFAPGHLDGSSKPGGEGTCVIAGHRDTHFSDLDRLEKGQIVGLEDEKGGSHSYRVVRTAVVEERDTWVVTDNDGPTLVLVTCWPIDSPLPGGTQRYVVWAEAFSSDPDPDDPPVAFSRPTRCDLRSPPRVLGRRVLQTLSLSGSLSLSSAQQPRSVDPPAAVCERGTVTRNVPSEHKRSSGPSTRALAVASHKVVQ